MKEITIHPTEHDESDELELAKSVENNAYKGLFWSSKTQKFVRWGELRDDYEMIKKLVVHVRKRTPTHAKTQKHKDKTKYNRAYTVDDIDVLI